MGSLREDIAASIDATLHQRARRNELRLTWVRAAALGLACSLDWTSHLHPDLGFAYPRLDLGVPLLTSSWLAVTFGLLFVLRRGWYSRWLAGVMPVYDGLLVGSTFLNAARSLGPSSFAALLAPPAGIVCAVLAASGGLRFSRASATTTTALAMAVFGAIGLTCRLSAMTLVYAATFLAAAGLLGAWMSDMARTLLEDEIGRRTLERFLPDRVIAGAYGDPLRLLEEPRAADATVLVSDLRGFTALAEKMAPAEVLAFLSEIQGELAAAVRANGGTVDKFMGDGMLAVFGAPEPLPDHAARAIRATRDLRAALARVNGRRRAQGQLEVRLGVGLHSGPVVAGCLGSGARLEFTVIGDTVNTASRLEALTKEKGVDVLVSEETARRAGPDGLAPLGEVALRGRTEALRIHTLAA
ncbi:MAG: adenylate/guanylate cyclase domain-containing protein [Myxococcales bacterium]